MQPQLKFRRGNPSQLLVGLTLIACLIGLGYSIATFGAVGLAVAFIPLILWMGFYALDNPAWTMIGLFVGNYLIMSLSKYLYKTPLGMLLDIMIAFSFFTLVITALHHKVAWHRAQSGLTLVAAIWALYCCLELVNPSGTLGAWSSAVRSYALIFLLVVILSQIVFIRYKHLQYLLIIWSILTLCAVLKACVQKFIGFNDAENYWLFVLGGRSTHIIGTGVRYFSFFSDAANYGASMGLSVVIFSITGFYTKNKFLRGWFFLVAVAACYGMLLSGTRSAMAVPFGGLALFVILSRQTKTILVGSIMLFAALFFLNFTSIGQGNALIRRARSAFNQDDPSYVVRRENQKKLRTLMVDRPFGIGLGMAGGKTLENQSNQDLPGTQSISDVRKIPTDSWFVMVWVESGVVGLILHIAILLYILGYGSFIIFFRLKDKQLKGLTAALVAGIFGTVIASYANEIFGQIPTGVIMYMSMAFIFLAPSYDRELADKAEVESQKRLFL
ncbi:MAG: O-antigen ligase family protein [Alistipes sp.]